MLQGRCDRDRYMGCSIWEEWDAKRLDNPRPHQSENNNKSYKVADIKKKKTSLKFFILNLTPTKQLSFTGCSTWVIMNRETRKLSKIPEQVREEVRPFFLERTILSQIHADKKIGKLNEETAQHIRSGLAVSIAMCIFFYVLCFQFPLPNLNR